MKKNDGKWEVLDSKYLSREPWFTVRRDHVKLPNGNEIPDYYILEYPNWVNTIAITKNREFVFVRQYRHGLRDVMFELCAGVCEKEDTSPMVSAQRELLEETGYGNGEWKPFMVASANAGTHSNLVYSFLVTDVEKITEPHLENTEDLSVHLFTFDEVKKLLVDGEIKQAQFAAPLWKYIAENGGL